MSKEKISNIYKELGKKKAWKEFYLSKKIFPNLKLKNLNKYQLEYSNYKKKIINKLNSEIKNLESKIKEYKNNKNVNKNKQ